MYIGRTSRTLDCLFICLINLQFTEQLRTAERKNVMQTRTETTWQCTRPRLAAILISKGYEPNIMPSPWQPDKKLWVFNVTEGLAMVVQIYYSEIGKPTPKAIAKYLSEVQ